MKTELFWTGVIVLVACAVLGETTRKEIELPSSRSDLDSEIAHAKEMVKLMGEGYVIVGQVVLDGEGDPRDVDAQMNILRDGFFADAVKDLVRPIGFRMHQYAPVDVPLSGQHGDPVNLGEIHLQPLPANKLSKLTGRVKLQDGESGIEPEVSLSVTNGPVNTPSNGTQPRSHWPEPIRATVDKDGRIAAEGFSPIEYWVQVKAPGYVDQGFGVQFKEGQPLDLGTITLEQPCKLKLTYIVAKEPPFDLDKTEETTLQGGARWKATPDIYGWDLEFKQEDMKLVFNSSYAPAMLADLGEGSLADFAKRTNSPSTAMLPPNRVAVAAGHVYLLNQAHWKHWVLFKLDIEQQRTLK